MQYQNDPNSFATDRDGAAFFGWSRATFWRRVQDGTIPQPVKIGRTSRWRWGWLYQLADDAEREAA